MSKVICGVGSKKETRIQVSWFNIQVFTLAPIRDFFQFRMYLSMKSSKNTARNQNGTEPELRGSRMNAKEH